MTSLANNFSVQKSLFKKHFWMLNFYLYTQIMSIISTTHSVNGTQIMSIISIRIIAVINTMSTSQSINAAPVKTSNGASRH